MTGMWTLGWMVGWKGAAPKSSHHRGLARCHAKEKKRMVPCCPCSKILKAHYVAMGGGMHQVSGGVHLDVGILRLAHRVSTHLVKQLVHGGGLGEDVQKRREGTRKRSSFHKIVDQAFPPM